MKSLIIALFLFTFAAQAEDSIFGSDIAFGGSTQVKFLSYDLPTRTYSAISYRFPGEGSVSVTPEAIARAIKGVSLEQIQRDPEALLRVRFLTVDADKELTTLMPSEKRARRFRNR